MSLQGILTIDAFGLILLAVIVHLVRTQRLHVGYAVLWLVTTAVVMLIVSVPWLLHGVTRAVGALFPASALSLLAFGFIFIILIFFSVKLTALSSRQTRMLQALALRELNAREPADDSAAIPAADAESETTR